MKSMLRLISATFVLAFNLPAGSASGATAAETRPNVLIVLTDDQGYGDLSVHGNPILKTPHLDRLHAESVRFTDFHVAPMCTPTRGQLYSLSCFLPSHFLHIMSCTNHIFWASC